MNARYELRMRSQDVTERDIRRMFPANIGSAYRYAHIVLQSNADKSHGSRIKELVRKTLHELDVPVTVKSMMFVYSGEPMIAVELED